MLGDEDDEEESDAVVSQVLDELGLQLTDDLAGVAVPTDSLAASTVKGGKGKAAVAAGADGGGGGDEGGAPLDSDADLQARLDDLRRE